MSAPRFRSRPAAAARAECAGLEPSAPLRLQPAPPGCAPRTASAAPPARTAASGAPCSAAAQPRPPPSQPAACEDRAAEFAPRPVSGAGAAERAGDAWGWGPRCHRGAVTPAQGRRSRKRETGWSCGGGAEPGRRRGAAASGSRRSAPCALTPDVDASGRARRCGAEARARRGSWPPRVACHRRACGGRVRAPARRFWASVQQMPSASASWLGCFGKASSTRGGKGGERLPPFRQKKSWRNRAC